jgi:hypothetical protein
MKMWQSLQQWLPFFVPRIHKIGHIRVLGGLAAGIWAKIGLLLAANPENVPHTAYKWIGGHLCT